MTTSGTASWNPDILRMAEEAYERCGLQLRGGYELRTAVRSLEFLMAEWAVRGLNFWTLDEEMLTLSQGVLEYELPADTVDVLMHHIRIIQAGQPLDYNVFRISEATYTNIVNKAVQGRPTQLMLHRGLVPSIKIWPVPDQTYLLPYLRVRRLQDPGNPTNTLDIPFRFIPAMAAGLAYQIARKRQDVPMERVLMLKQDYEEAYSLAAAEDVDRADYQIVPFKSWL